jgi:diguanylate cyclase (GGDEF)-like protein
MRFLQARVRPKLRLSLTQQVTLLSLVPIVALGFILTRVIERQVESHSLSDASQSARLIANIGIQPRLTQRELSAGLNGRQVRELDDQLRQRSTTENLARIKVWNAGHTVIYSDEHRLIGRTLAPSEDLESALAGRPKEAEVVAPQRSAETASEVGFGKLVEVYVPLRFVAAGPPVGAFEIYLSYRPIAASIAADKRTIVIVVAVGLALLWAILFRIVARASRRLRRQSRENYRLARYDQLTGLPNRTLFCERAAAVRGAADRHRDALAVLLIDLDRFKEINHTLGNPTGDEVLREIARRLQAQLGEDTLVARLGGDEYAILCPRTNGVSGALATASRVQSSMEPPIMVDGVALNVEASIGVAALEDHVEDLDGLLQHADAALARAKARHSRVEVYSPEYDSFDQARLLLLGQVRTALERGEFELHYQPKIDLRTRRISGVEALLRWRHPEQGLLMPKSFIPLVEQTALVGPVTLHVIDQALAQLVRWRERGIHLNMAVNLSARNLLDLDLPGQVAALLHRHDVPAERLTVEVTESATMGDPHRAAEVLCALRASGLGVSIDDFGTGNASIAYLTSLPANEIKVDRSFVTGICEDAHAEAITRSTIDLARHLDLHVVAEGIETRPVLERLIELGCDTGQGYLISRPLAAEQLTPWLVATSGAPLEPPPAADAARRGAAVAADGSAAAVRR